MAHSCWLIDGRHILTWEAATERLCEASVLTVGERQRQKAVADGALTVAHAVAGAGPSGDLVRLLAGGDTAAWQVGGLQGAREAFSRGCSRMFGEHGTWGGRAGVVYHSLHPGLVKNASRGVALGRCCPDFRYVHLKDVLASTTEGYVLRVTTCDGSEYGARCTAVLRYVTTGFIAVIDSGTLGL